MPAVAHKASVTDKEQRPSKGRMERSRGTPARGLRSGLQQIRGCIQQLAETSAFTRKQKRPIDRNVSRVDLLRRACNEHPVAVVVIASLEIAAFQVVVSIIAGHFVVPYAGIAASLIGLAFLGWRRLRARAR
jgi:hypothetical protein